MRTSNQLKAGALLSYVNLGISTIIPLLYTPIMLRILGQAEYGLYSLSNSIISYLSLLTLGLGSAIVRYLMKYRTSGDKRMLERTAGLFLVMYSFLALAACVVGIGLTGFTGTFFAKGLTDWEIHRLNILIVLMSVSTGISFVSGVYSSISICYERYLFRRVVEILGTIASPLLNLVMLYAGYASIGMASIGVVIQLVTLAVNIWFCICKLDIHPQFQKFPMELLKEIFSFSVFVFIGMIADLLYWATDKILIGALVGSAAVAIYNVGATFHAMLQNMSAAISGVFAPRVNQLVFSGASIDENSKLLIRIGRIQYLVVSLMLSGFIVFGQSFIQLWAGSDYLDAYTVALLTMIPLAIPLIQNIAFTTIMAQNNHRFRSILYAVLAVCNVVGTYLLLPIMGIVGAALCTCIVFVVGHGICMNWYYYKKVGLDIPSFWGNILKMTIVPAGMICISFLLQRAGVVTNTIWSFAVGVIVYTGVFCVFSWLFSMNQYEKDLVSELIKRTLPKRSH